MTETAPRRRLRRNAEPSTDTSNTEQEAPEQNTDENTETVKAPRSRTKGGTPVASENGEQTPLFETAPGQRLDPKNLPRPDMQHGFQTIVNDLFLSGFNVVEEWKIVRDSLEIKDALTPQSLRLAANRQESVADRAHQLFIIAKVEVNAYMRETESTFGAIRDAAIQNLEKMKAAGSRSKQITDADAKTEAARMFPDEWADICTRRDRAEGMLAHIANMAQLARARCYTVSSLANFSSNKLHNNG